MNRSIAELARPAAERLRGLLRRRPKLSPDKTAALLFGGALLSLVVAMFPPGFGTPDPVFIPPPPATRPVDPDRGLIVAPVTALAPASTALAVDPGTSPGETEDPFLTDLRRRARENPEEALLWLQQSVAGPRRLQGMLEVVALWGSQDAEAALLWLESNAEGLVRLETLQAGIRLWSEGDPLTAAQWIEGMANDGSKTAAAEALAGHWAERAPEEAAGWVESLGFGPVRDSAAAALVESWAARAPDAAARWARSEAAGRGDFALLEDAVERYTAQDPAGALNFIRSLNPGVETAAAARAYVRSGAQQYPADTAAWIAALPPGDPLYQDSHAGDLMREWALSDSVAASAWLEDQPDGRLREAAAAAFTATILPYEPAAAAVWSNSLADPRLRVESLEKSVGAWASQDPEAAREWIAQADLEPQLRIHLADFIPPDS